MPQEFLASFAVDIDEAGVSRLQTVLQQNRDLADGLAAAFDAARSSIQAFIQYAAEELPALPFFSPGSSAEEISGASGAFSVDLDFGRASRQLETFLATAKKQMRLTADGSAIVSAASAALSQVRSLFSGANLTLKVKTETEGKPAVSGRTAGTTVMMLSSGGRFSSPTRAEIAEDGDPEYVVPVKKENEAVPLLRSLLSELSPSARESLNNALAPAGARGVIPDEAGGSLPGLLSAAASAVAPVVRQTTSNNIQAPVNIRVEASSADPEAVGRSIYDTAERYMLRTLQNVG